MVLDGVTAAVKASKDSNVAVDHRGPTDWLDAEDVSAHRSIVTNSLSVHNGEALPYLLQLADQPGTNSVVHIAVLSKAHLAGLSEPGSLTVVHSTTTQEAYDMALCAHALANQGCGPVVHLIDSVRTAFAQSYPLRFPAQSRFAASPSSTSSSGSSGSGNPLEDSVSSSGSDQKLHAVESVERVFQEFNEACRGEANAAEYKAFEYFGSDKAERVIVATGVCAKSCIEWIRRKQRMGEDVSDFGVVNVRVSSPWSPSHFLHALPSSVKVVVASEDVFGEAAASFHHHAVPAAHFAHSPVFQVAQEHVAFERLGHAMFGCLSEDILEKSASSLVQEVIVCQSTPTAQTLPMGEILGVHMGMKVQDYESRNELTGTIRKEVRFSALDISQLQFPIQRADVLCVEHASQLDEAMLAHVGRDTVVIVNAASVLGELSPNAKTVLSSVKGVRVFGIDAEAIARKVGEDSAEAVPFVLMGSALHFATTYAQSHGHLASQIVRVLGQTETARALCHELAEPALLAHWLKKVDLPHVVHPTEFHHDHHENLFHPIALDEELPALERSEDVLQLLQQLFSSRVAVSEPKRSLETSLGAFMAWTAEEKRAKSRWIVARASKVRNVQAVHHILSSNESVGVVLLCSEVNSVIARDVGLYAMNYGNAYVASVAIDGSHAQAVKAFTEAEKFRAHGPSVILAFVGDKSAVQSGEWPLYRWNPHVRTGADPFVLDSAKLKSDLHEFLKRDQQLSLMALRAPKLNPSFSKSADLELEKRGKAGLERHQEKRKFSSSFASLRSGLSGATGAGGAAQAKTDMNILVLYGSDSGRGASVAEKLARKAEASGCGETRYMEANQFKVEDLENETVVLFIISTAGQGEDCTNAKHFTAALADSKTRLPKLRFAVFGLGDSHYWGEGSADSAKYFCLPARRLFDKLKGLGAQPLSEVVGLGDDQNDDGYDGALGEWEPAVWAKLEVKVVAPPVAKPPTDDEIKIWSNYLRGTIAEGLADLSTGKLVFEDTKLTKFHGIYMQDDRELREAADAKGLERPYSYMIRIGVPGGVATAQQYLDMDALCDQYCTGRLKITTRQAYQFHGIIKKNLKLTMQGINKACMDTLAACGDVHRNILANPRVHDGRVYEQVAELAQAINAHLKPRTTAYHEIWLDRKPVAGYQDHEPLYGQTYLPRKFKVAIAVPPENDVDVFAHCTGFIAIVKNDKLLGYNVCAGGGLGTSHGDKATYPRLSDVLGFCLPEQAVKVVEAIMVTQRDHGERLNRRHARLKYTVEDHGYQWYREQVEKYCGFKLEEAKPFKFDTNADSYGWRKGKHTGLWTYTMFVENGYIHDENPEYQLKTGLKEIAHALVKFNGQISLTANQNLILGAIPEERKHEIVRLLEKYHIDNSQYSQMRLHSMACVALPTCALAMAESQRYLPSLISKLEVTLDEVGLRHDAITIRMTGCPNGCGRPYLAEIAFIGKAPGIYNLHLGGGFAGNRLNRIYREGVNEEQILEIVRPMLRNYAKERLQGEHFGDFLLRTKVLLPVYHGHSFWAKDESENDTSTRSGTVQLYW